MQFMVFLNRNKEVDISTLTSEQHEAEITAARRLYGAGTIRNVWVRGGAGGAILLAEATDEAALAKELATLPFIKLGVLAAPEIIELNPYHGFAAPRTTSSE